VECQKVILPDSKAGLATNIARARLEVRQFIDLAKRVAVRQPDVEVEPACQQHVGSESMKQADRPLVPGNLLRPIDSFYDGFGLATLPLEPGCGGWSNHFAQASCCSQNTAKSLKAARDASDLAVLHARDHIYSIFWARTCFRESFDTTSAAYWYPVYPPGQLNIPEKELSETGGGVVPPELVEQSSVVICAHLVLEESDLEECLSVHQSCDDVFDLLRSDVLCSSVAQDVPAFIPANVVLPETYSMKRYSFKSAALSGEGALPKGFRMKRYSFKRQGCIFPFGSASDHIANAQATLVPDPGHGIAGFCAWASRQR